MITFILAFTAFYVTWKGRRAEILDLFLSPLYLIDFVHELFKSMKKFDKGDWLMFWTIAQVVVGIAMAIKGSNEFQIIGAVVVILSSIPVYLLKN